MAVGAEITVADVCQMQRGDDASAALGWGKAGASQLSRERRDRDLG